MTAPKLSITRKVNTIFVASHGRLTDTMTDYLRALSKRSGMRLIATDKTAEWLKEQRINVEKASSFRSEVMEDLDGLKNRTIPEALLTGIYEPWSEETLAYLSGNNLPGIDMVVVDLGAAMEHRPKPTSSLEDTVDGIPPIVSQLITAGVRNGRLVVTSVEDLAAAREAIESDRFEEEAVARGLYTTFASNAINRLLEIMGAVKMSLSNLAKEVVKSGVLKSIAEQQEA